MPLSETDTSRQPASGTPERQHGPGTGAAERHSRRTAPSRGAFWLVAAVFCLMFCTAGAPTPLYGIYRAQLGFSATTLTAVFAAYALVLLLTLLVFGSVSDYLGRRPVILAALTVTAGACAVFLGAHSVGLLLAARALQGVAVGTATVAFRGLTPRTAMLDGCLVLVAGLAMTFAADAAASAARHPGTRP
jgi:MFS family permease